jgi:hypothetical protein
MIDTDKREHEQSAAGSDRQMSASIASVDPLPESRTSTKGSGPGVGRLIVFFLFLAAVAIGLNACIAFGVRHVRSSTLGTWNVAMQGQANTDILITGSSRATYHYDPRIIRDATGLSAFNLGRVGSQTDVQLVALKGYLEHNRQPRIVIHNLDAFSFVATTEIFEYAQYVPYLQDPAIYDPLRRIDPSIVKSRYIPLYGYVVEDMNYTWLTGLGSLAGWRSKDDCTLGFCPRRKTWTEDFAKFRAVNPHGVDFAIQPRGVEALEELIQLCKSKGITLILVYSPEYSEMQKMTTDRGLIFSKFREMANRNGVLFWDYSNWEHAADRAYFYNSQHLNATGAESFSEDLAARLKAGLADGTIVDRATQGKAEMSAEGAESTK